VRHRQRQPRESLWLTRSRKPLTVRLSRWADYPHFIETLEEFGNIPELVTVKWGAFTDFTKYDFDELDRDEDESESAADDDWAFVRDVAARMKAGADIPPLIREKGFRFDGVHRAFAAKSLSIRTAPIVELVRP